jgi:hypothetical protein
MIARLRRSRFALPLWLVVALLWAPFWGQSHGIAHELEPALTSANQGPASMSSIAHASDDHAIGSSLCQVLDHLAHATALTAWSVQVLPHSLPDASLPTHACRSVPHRLPWAVQARAPPAQI